MKPLVRQGDPTNITKGMTTSANVAPESAGLPMDRCGTTLSSQLPSRQETDASGRCGTGVHWEDAHPCPNAEKTLVRALKECECLKYPELQSQIQRYNAAALALTHPDDASHSEALHANRSRTPARYAYRQSNLQP